MDVPEPTRQPSTPLLRAAFGRQRRVCDPQCGHVRRAPSQSIVLRVHGRPNGGTRAHPPLGVQAPRPGRLGGIPGGPSPRLRSRDRASSRHAALMKGRAWARHPPPTPPSNAGVWGTAALSRRRDVTLAPSQAAGGGGLDPGGPWSGRRAAPKCIRSDFNGSGRSGGGGSSPTTGYSTTCQRVAAPAGLLTAGDAARDGAGLDAVDLIAGCPVPDPVLRPRWPGSGGLGCTNDP